MYIDGNQASKCTAQTLFFSEHNDKKIRGNIESATFNVNLKFTFSKFCLIGSEYIFHPLQNLIVHLLEKYQFNYMT